MAELAVAAIPAVIAAGGAYANQRASEKAQKDMAKRQMAAQEHAATLFAPQEQNLATSEAFAPPPPTLVSPLLKGTAKNVLESPAAGISTDKDEELKKLAQSQTLTGGMGV